MTTGGVVIEQVDGALGVSGDVVGDVFAVVGTSSKGDVNYPVTFVNPSDIAAYFGEGPLVEHACYLAGGKPVVCVRMPTVTDGSCGTIDVTKWSGTSVCSIHTGSKASFEFDVILEIVIGGTIGQAGVVLRYSLDGGYNWSAETSLGTANTFTIPNSGGVQFDFAAGTVIAGATASVRTIGPKEDSAGALAAQSALRLSSIAWDAIHVATPQDASGIASWDAFISDLWAKKKHKKGVVFVRDQNVGESNAAWQTALGVIRSTVTSIYLSVCAGYIRATSRASGRRYRFPVALSFSKRASEVSRPTRTDLAEPALGPLPGVSIIDKNGALCEHDEDQYPGLDKLHFVVAKTIPGQTGVFLEKPNIFCPDGSDYYLWQYRSVINRVSDAVQLYLVSKLRKPIPVDKKTGFIRASVATDIDEGGKACIKDVVSEGPDASDYSFRISRTDNLLATNPLSHVTVRIVPLGYPNQFGVTIGFVNPARGAL